ncbi:MAG: AbrB/MazE/SpoVT family DNA-binding domain-containing protein [Gammaproteobacteria bacterium]|nr:AbrB/MazE/SpoVT family DNA-binding domain-containing protein [Gammaproteobacteria bacterium]
MRLKITTVGNSVGVVLPKEMLAKLRVAKGDTLYASETADGFKITPYDEEFERQMAVAEKIMRNRRNLLKELAK